MTSPSLGANEPHGEDRPHGLGETISEWLSSAVQRLDGYGPAAWIGVTLLAFILLAPLGVALIVYLFWSGRMGRLMKFGKSSRCRGRGAARATGNAAFDAYRDETLKRLEEEREAFETYLQRLREAKDKAEFEQFMAERRAGGAPGAAI